MKDVREVFAAAAEAPLRRCPRCGAEARTRFENCPECGTSYFWRPPRLRRRARFALVAGGIALLGVAAAILVPEIRESTRDRDARERGRHAALVARERARLIREQAPRVGRPRDLRPPAAGAAAADKVAARRALLAELEADITRDARRRVRSGEMSGPIRETRCGPLSPTAVERGEEDDLSKERGRYSCVAVIRDVVQNGRVVGGFGHDFVATVDFRRFSYVWCRNNPPPGERGRPLVVVRLDRACLGAEGLRPLGTGYVLPERRR